MPEEVKELKTKLTLDVKDFSAGTQTAADDAESLKKEIEDLKEQIRKLGPEAKKSGQETESALNQVVKKFLGFAAVAAVIKSSWQNIQTLDRSLLQLRSNLGASSQEVEDFADSFSKLSSMSKSTLLSLSADFTTTLRSIFNDQNTMAKLTERVMKQVENISNCLQAAIQPLKTLAYTRGRKYSRLRRRSKNSQTGELGIPSPTARKSKSLSSRQCGRWMRSLSRTPTR